MSLPEISRRCRSCGAAVRTGARFCPQCGVPMADAAAAAEADGGTTETRVAESPRVPAAARKPEPPREVAPPPVTEPRRDATTSGEWTPPTKEYAAFAQSFGVAGTRAGADETSSPGAQTPPAASASSSGAREGDVPRREDEPAPTARARVARVRDGTRARVGRMREEAIVVLEETPDDSGMRFVVAAAALFIVFLVLLFLSTTILR